MPIWASACAPASSCAGQDADSGRAGRVLQTKEIAKYKLPERLEIMDDFPLSTFGKVSKKRLVEMVSGQDRKRNRARQTRPMRIIDLHCYPNTEPWIKCQGPYVEALAKYWNRQWTWKQRRRGRRRIHRRRRRGGARRARPRDHHRHAALHERIREGDAAAPSRAHHPSWARGRSAQGRDRDPTRRRRRSTS